VNARLPDTASDFAVLHRHPSVLFSPDWALFSLDRLNRVPRENLGTLGTLGSPVARRGFALNRASLFQVSFERFDGIARYARIVVNNLGNLGDSDDDSGSDGPHSVGDIKCK